MTNSDMQEDAQDAFLPVQPRPNTSVELKKAPKSKSANDKQVDGKKQRWFRRPLFLVPISALLFLVVFYFLLNDVVMPLYVKSGATATVPNVVGMGQNVAMQVLKNAKYEPVQYELRFDDKAAEGTIIRQTPEAGEQTKPGRKVFLIISGGKEMAIVPDLRGKSLRDAKIALLKDNLYIGTTNYSFSDSTPNGIVFSQYPAPGIKISASTKVNITVSQGALVGRVPVPDMRKLTLSAAIAKLNEAKLTLGNVSFQTSPEGTPGTVIEQYPSPGDLVNENSTVDLFVIRENSGKTPQH
jgi:beta-lactam-binding protein with PASTA domain